MSWGKSEVLLHKFWSSVSCLSALLLLLSLPLSPLRVTEMFQSAHRKQWPEEPHTHTHAQQHCYFTHGTDQSLASMQTSHRNMFRVSALIHPLWKHRTTLSCHLWNCVFCPRHTFTASAVDTIHLPLSLFKAAALLQVCPRLKFFNTFGSDIMWLKIEIHVQWWEVTKYII